MANKLNQEARMTIQTLAERGQSNRAIARLLGVHENAVRYHRHRAQQGTVDGRTQQKHLAADFQDAIATWLERLDDDGPLNLAALHDWLVVEHHYPGSLRSLQRYFKAHFPQPKIRARRRIETPPGAQAQANWGEFPRVLIAGRRQHLSAFALKLSLSRFPVLIWSPCKSQLAWHQVYLEPKKPVRKALQVTQVVTNVCGSVAPPVVTSNNGEMRVPKQVPVLQDRGSGRRQIDGCRISRNDLNDMDFDARVIEYVEFQRQRTP